ncbi:MAG TPA: glycosyltransferase, partial [Candidatus Sulfotelmatobacter sp.]|nr:glycosyltransferase [Candidatus Sulfotelmatobacter sp.]
AGGRLVIETPDVEASAQLFLDPRVSYVQKQAVLRHLFGSHEAQWAYHYDAWYESKFQRVLSALGFQNIHSERKRWQMTCNITVTATRGQRVPLEQQKSAVTALLSESQVDDSVTEQRLCAVWRGKFEQVLMTRGAFAPAPAETGTLAPESDEPVKAPKLSIFMPVYNRERYLAATLDSLLAQTFGDFEIILADDGSTDRSLVIARQYAQRDSRIRVLALPHQGEVAARNAALRQAHPRTQYLMNHDSDDLSMPSKLLKLITHLEAHPEIAIVGCLAEYFNDKGQQLGQPPLESQPERIRATFGQTNSMVNSAALIRRSVFEAIGGYREDFRSVDDYDFFARALLAGFNLANVPETLHRIRLHPNSVGSTRAQQQQKLAEQIRLHYRAGQVASPLAVPASKSSVRSKVDKAPLSILHTVEFYAPHIGGAEVVVQQISERLAKRGHRVTVATTHLDDRQFRELNGVTVVGFNVQGKLAEGISGEARPYQQFLREHPADVMMNYAAQQWATDLALEALHDVRDRRVNVIAPCGYSALADERTVRWPRFLQYFQNALPAALPLYDAAVYHSSIYKDYLFGLHLGLKNGVIIPNGTDEAEFTQPVVVNFREKYGITTRFIGLCVANFYPGKGQERLIHCVRQMNRPDFTMVFIGKEGSQLASLQQQASGLNIRFLAGISRQDTVAAFRTADLFLFGSHIEASPLVIIEAKAARLPFLSTDCGNVREWQGGLVCAPEELAAQANRLLDNETLRKQLAEDGWREWKQKLTWDAVVDQ